MFTLASPSSSAEDIPEKYLCTKGMKPDNGEESDICVCHILYLTENIEQVDDHGTPTLAYALMHTLTLLVYSSFCPC